MHVLLDHCSHHRLPRTAFLSPLQKQQATMVSSSAASAVSQLPDLPLICLSTAKSTSLSDEFQGKTTVIDFWTTKCTRCPGALDKLSEMAAQPEFASIRFASVCCDSCDGAREILEKPDAEPRWSTVSHFFMDRESKEVAKKVLGFKAVPFYVVVNDRGEIVQKGSPKQVDLQRLAVVERSQMKENAPPSGFVEREFNMDDDF